MPRSGAFTARILRAARRKLAVLALFGLLLAAQALLIAHSIEHAGIGGSVDCVLCLAADHLSGPTTAAIPSLSVAAPEGIEPQGATPFVTVASLPYRSRGPPAHLTT